MIIPKHFCLKVDGEYALFARPELRADKVSYEVPTISAITGLLQSIYWKPQMKYVIEKIHVLKKPKFSAQTISNLKKVMKTDKDMRSTTYLYDVSYVIEFHIERTFVNANESDNQRKHEDIFERRVMNSQAKRDVYLGVRECPCAFELITEEEIPESEMKGKYPLGVMLRDIDFSGEKPAARFWNPVMENGIITVTEETGDTPSEGFFFENLIHFYDKHKDSHCYPGYECSREHITYEVLLEKDGTFAGIHPLKQSKMMVPVPVTLTVPKACIRTSKPVANFLWDNEKYILGFYEKETYVTEKRDIFIQKIENLKEELQNSNAFTELQAISSFYQKFPVEEIAASIEKIEKQMQEAKEKEKEEKKKAKKKPERETLKEEKSLSEEEKQEWIRKCFKNIQGNFVFRIKGYDRYVHENPELMAYWKGSVWAEYKNTEEILCLLSGQKDRFCEIHPNIKRIAGQSSMTKLISLDKDSTTAEVYGWKGFENGPTGKLSVHKYGTVLNDFVTGDRNCVHTPKGTFIFWTQNDDENLTHNLKVLFSGEGSFQYPVPEGEVYYIAEIRNVLGSASGRCFLNNYVRCIYGEDIEDLTRILIHFKKESAPLATDKKNPYEFYLTGLEEWEMKEERNLQEVSLGYKLGRLYAYMEQAQMDAVPSTKDSKPMIKTLYFAAHKPGFYFSREYAHTQIHLNKIDYGMGERISEIMESLQEYEEPFPKVLSVREQAQFVIGYDYTRSVLKAEKMERIRLAEERKRAGAAENEMEPEVELEERA